MDNIPTEYRDRVRVLPNGCWQWTGNMVGLHNKTGSLPYGVLFHDGKQVRAHRYFYELATGEVIGKRHLHHKCENTLCVNPAHLEPMTQAEHNRVHGTMLAIHEAARASETCRHGHQWAENAYFWKGVRLCKACAADAQRKRRAANYVPPVRKATCPQGHPYEGENLLIDSRGARNCRICLRANGLERKRRYRERLKQRRAES